jgi:hypothetical protein
MVLSHGGARFVVGFWSTIVRGCSTTSFPYIFRAAAKFGQM